MSHAANTELLETLYEEVTTEWINDLSFVAEILNRPVTEDDLYQEGLYTEVMKRFEAMS